MDVVADTISRYENKCKLLGIVPLKIMYNKGYIVMSNGDTETSEYSVPKFVTDIEDYAFSNNIVLEKIKFNSEIWSIGVHTFSGCSGLIDINLENVKNIKKGAFYNCTKIKEINLKECNRIGEYAFGYCYRLEKAIIDKVTDIDNSVFEYCNKMKYVKLCEGLKNIGESAFSNCSSLELDVKHLRNVERISKDAFSECSNIRGVLQLDKATEIRIGCFNGSGISGVIINSDVDIPSYAFMHCYNVEYVKLNGDVKTIYKGAFRDCENLKEIKFNEGLGFIGYEAFANCGKLEVIKLPKGLRVLDSGAFTYCEGLKEVYIGKDTRVNETAFDGCRDDLKIIRY